MNAPPPFADQFPFPDQPGEPGEKQSARPTPSKTGAAAQDFPFPSDAEEPIPKPSSVPAGGGTADRSFPFPGEPESSSSSSSSSSPAGTPESPEKSEETPPPAEPGRRLTRAQRRPLPKVEDLDRREANDLEVSRYYATTGNFAGSYLRAQDAVKTFPDDPLAHFALAEAAVRLNKKDEAMAEYRVCLLLEPNGEKSGAARKALGQPSPK